MSNYHVDNGGKLLQGTVSRVILEISQASGPEDNLQIRSVREQGTFFWVVGHSGTVLHVAKLRESFQVMIDYNLQPTGPPSTGCVVYMSPLVVFRVPSCTEATGT